MDALQRLLNSSRPFKPFKVTLSGEEHTFFARKLSVADNAAIRDAARAAYETANDDSDVDHKSLSFSLSKMSVESIAKFITNSDRGDYLQEASSLLDDKPVTDDEVKAKAAEIAEERYQEYIAESKETLAQLAIERKANIKASGASSEASARKSISLIVYVENEAIPGQYEPLFPSMEDVTALAFEDIIQIMNASFQVLAPVKAEPDPLSSPPQSNSSEPSSSQSPSVEASTPTSGPSEATPSP